MKTPVSCCWIIAILLALGPIAHAQFLRDHYAPGVTPSEGLGGSVAVNAKYLIGGRPVSVGVLATWNNRTQSALCLNAP